MFDYNLLPNNARVWVYQSNKSFTDEQTAAIDKKLQTFVNQWQSHNNPLHAWAGIRYNRFVIFVVDESYEALGGCAIDNSIAVIKSIEQEYSVNMLDRFNFAYKNNENTVQSVGKDQFTALYADGQINNDTIVFNNLVQTKADLESKWEVALGDSWHRNMV